ncbi:MAG: hypothetical protein C6W58_16230 [Bacillaceae bacterium]|jgi:hypothetical protein|uniref:Uncharacterized protein n=1 Tax=Aeribacillus composti TaxID=1868734 RepID=A0ABY9WBK0_9BACI|nr:hypothetical protein [Aeribacillus composti]REJ12696.1 MAG: hypothetical protein C6W58_16230 [Bacillaceae bacterium]TVZ86120.1 hypothetical protein FB379_105110 [Aeribacillus composti]WNF32466.1 hypothetical protein RI196_14510 [Aeribacillus composti]BBU40584.1 hypothetical protein APP_28760 [Aeribacillus pallidus]
MRACPLCNGFQQLHKYCSKCGGILLDAGKITDYLDDYSAYMEMDLMKLLDGKRDSLKNHQCIHLLYCSQCHEEEHAIIQET